MRCPHCHNHVLQKSGTRTRVRIKGRITLENGMCKAQCYWCGEDVELPLELQKGTTVETEEFTVKLAPVK